MISAKLGCESVTRTAGSEQVVMKPVYSPDPTSENYSWSQATPSGRVELCITNKAAFGRFVPGKEYLVTFEEAQ